MSFGKNPSGQLIEDPTVNQAFSNVARDAEALEARVQVLEAFIAELPKQVETAMSLIADPESTSVAHLNTAIVALVDALNDLSNRVKKL